MFETIGLYILFPFDNQFTRPKFEVAELSNDEKLISIPANKNRELVLSNFYRLFNYQSAFP